MREVIATLQADGGIGLEIMDLPRLHGVALERGNTISTRVRCLYMDAGVWAGTQYNFGVLYGDSQDSYAAICDYVPGDGFRPAPALMGEELLGCSTSHSETIRNFLNACHAREIEGGWFSDIDTAGKLYFILGDLHLPVVSRRSPGWILHQRDGLEPPEPFCSVDGRYMRSIIPDLRDFFHDPVLDLSTRGLAEPLAPDMDRLEMDRIDTWWEHYFENDIFSHGAAESLAAIRLKTLLERAVEWQNGRSGLPIHLVQVGDMYDFWVGLKCRFEQRDQDLDNAVVLGPDACGMHEECIRGSDCTGTQSVSRAVLDWFDRTHEVSLVERNGEEVCIAEWLHSDACAVRHKTWIYGNHDNYLRVLASDLGIPQRLMRFSENCIFIEHGHQGDDHNRDGETSGHAITQGGAFLWNLRSITTLWFAEEMNRETVLRRAVRVLRDPQRNLRAYIMGHTHTQYMAFISIGTERALRQPGE